MSMTKGSATARAIRYKPRMSPAIDTAHRGRPNCGMSGRSGDTMVCINIQGTLAIVPRTLTMAGTLAT